MAEQQRSGSEENNTSLTTQLSEVSIQIDEVGRRRRRRIYKVPPLQLAQKEHVYHPRVLSLGPYHHGRTQFPLVEDFKAKTLKWFLSLSVSDTDSGGSWDKAFFQGKILERIDEIRSYYEQGSTNDFTDEELAEMMLRDACFILYHLKAEGDRDYHPLDMLLIGLKYGTDGKEQVFSQLLNIKIRDDHDHDMLTQIPWSDNDEPPHLLAALRRILLFGQEHRVTELVRDQPHHRRRLLLLPCLDFIRKRLRWRSSSSSSSKSRRFYMEKHTISFSHISQSKGCSLQAVLIA
ncbi:hypothetical protein Salat_0968700 [Sesamum alatum]|uniref:Uncharacterized protein n=1 Tax=Sesamum alatum TaxID=300844 RepID=A0AAE2CRP4_9LAMI|nr:hypothetical protein Salat_0968700 [Sesamum alatum]